MPDIPTSGATESGTASRRREIIQRWYTQKIANFVEELDSIPEGTGSVLDNTLIVWLHEQGTGGHNRKEHGVALIGNLDGAVRTGQRVNFAREARTLNDLYLTLFELIGAPRSTFGMAELCNGPIRQIIA